MTRTRTTRATPGPTTEPDRDVARPPTRPRAPDDHELQHVVARIRGTVGHDRDPTAGPRLADAVRLGLAAPAAPLPRDVRGPLEQQFGRDLSPVRLHRGPLAAHSAGLLSARAYTVGAHIVLGGDQQQSLPPDTVTHEAAHAVQQGLGEPHDLEALERTSPSDVAERAAMDAVHGRRRMPVTGLAVAAQSGPTLTRSSLLPGPEFFAPRPIPADVRQRIEDWLDSRRIGISIQTDAGTISMPEVVARIRDEVPGAADVEVFQVEQLARQRLGHAAPPQTRGRQTPSGQTSELVARLKNLLGAKVEVGTDAANLVVSITGVVGRLRAPGVEATAEAGAGGVEGRVSVGGRATVTATPDSFGLRTTFPMGRTNGVFAARLSRSGDTWSRWSTSFSFPIVGRTLVDARPAVDAIGSSVRAAEQAIRDIAAHLHGGGSPTDDVVRERIGQITPAISNVGKAVEEQPGPSVTLRVQAGGGPREIGGRQVQEATAGVSLVIVF